jgi:hypothetical protein
LYLAAEVSSEHIAVLVVGKYSAARAVESLIALKKKW